MKKLKAIFARKKPSAQFGVPDWLIKHLGLPDTTQRVVLVASNRSFMLVSVKYYAKEAAK